MTIYTLSPDTAAQVQWDFLTNTAVFSSPLSGSEQTAELPGARFVATLKYSNLSAPAQRQLMVLLAQLRGPTGRVSIPISSVFPRQGQGGGMPVIYGAGQAGRTLTISGAPASIPQWLMAGDYVSFDGAGSRELHLVTQDVATDGTGRASIPIEPPMRGSPSSGAQVEINSPAAVMRLYDDGQASFTVKPARFSDATIKFIEAFPV